MTSFVFILWTTYFYRALDPYTFGYSALLKFRKKWKIFIKINS